MVNQFSLYHTDGCHLCEMAEAVISKVFSEQALTWSLTDIADDPDLVEAYGTRIPVLVEVASGRELGWPFDERMLIDWLQDP
jgi:hypothetical protein